MEIKINVNGNEWTYNATEAKGAIAWLLEDAQYLEKQAKSYDKKGEIWLAEQTTAAALWSRKIAKSISAKIEKQA